MKKLFFALLVTIGFASEAQVYNNEWIDYTKTYYKFKVGRTGLYRIPQSTLSGVGLGSTPAEHFKLWRNGVEVPIYTSKATGAFGASDYIEFWGQMNDGTPDTELYRMPDYHLNRKWSLETDTAAYFLTVHTGTNKRLTVTANNIAGNSLPAEPYFMYTAGRYFREKIHSGYAVNVGEYLYSSSYDKAEGWSSSDIGTNATQTTSLSNLFVYNGAGAPNARFNLAVSGNAIHPRRYKATINSDSVLGNNVDYFNYAKDSGVVAISSISSGTATIQITNNCFNANDRMVVHYYELTYPRQFNFGGATSFEFELPASAQGNYLQITGFNSGSTPPVLYDTTNGQRYIGDISNPSFVQFVLQPSSVTRKLVLVNQETGNITNITALQSRNFIDYRTAANQGDFMIITNPVLFNGPNGTNPVEEYRAYRSSTAGGGYNAKTYLEDEINDQYGFGIKKNPASIRNFIRYCRINFTVKPKHVFIIGKGVHYVHHRSAESHQDMPKLNLVTTFGWPGSDVLLTAEPGSSQPEISIGRLSAINGAEVALYLKKVKDFEIAQATLSPLIQDRGWMKNIVHIIGASDPNLQAILEQYMRNYGNLIKDTLFGGKVTTFSKTSSGSIQQLNNTDLQNLFAEGISLMTYFGHSSSTTLEFNLDNPENYYNPGKYPMFIGLGCNAGNFFNFNPLRFQTKETLSEKYVLSQDRGTIGFVASTHFGIVHYLDIWNSRAYKRITNTSYGKTFGEIMKETVTDVFNFTTQEDFYARANSEQTELHGDPAIRLNPHPKPDYVIEEPMVRVSPNFISIAEPSFKVNAKMMNIGKAPGRDIVVEVKRQYPNGTVQVVQRDTIPGIRYADSITVNLPIDPTRDKGLNKIIVTVEADNIVDEIYENNNSITKDVFIYEDEARPVYPYNFAIINKQNIKLVASTANPFSQSRQYRMEMDTTEFFNSSAKVTRTITAPGGVLEFDPGMSFTDSTVYYWRVAPVPSSGNNYTWNTSSFVYLPNYEVGFNQSHLHQQFKSSGVGVSLDSASKQWKFGTRMNNLFIRQGTWVTSGAIQQGSLSVSVNGIPSIRVTCWFQSVVFNVFDPVTFKPMVNTTIQSPSGTYPLGEGLYGSHSNNCFSGRLWNFEYRYTDSATRRKAMNFMQNVIPDGAYVVVRSFALDSAGFPSFPRAFVNDWLADEAVYGQGQTLYHYLKNAGLAGIDSFYRTRPFALVYKKNDPTFTPRWVMGDGVYDNPTLSVDCPSSDTVGFITSPVFGPAKAWKELHWRGVSLDATAGDNPRVSVVGIRQNGTRDTLIRNLTVNQQTVDVSTINAQQYPFAQLIMSNADTAHLTPYQLRHWRLTYVPAPEGAVAPNIFFQMKDTLEIGEPIDFKMAFKNVAGYDFDSLKVKMVVTDRNNVARVLPVLRHRRLTSSPDTLHIRYNIDTRQLAGANSLYVQVNPDNDQPEQYHFNNFIFKNFYVRGDTLNPLLDVTFDNVHILNNDIVSSKPDIMIKLKDEAKWFLLDTSSVVDVKVRFPDQTVRPYQYNNDTLKFLPAQQAPNSDNTATVNFKPYFPDDGTYELIVTGKDMSGNKAGTMEYRVSFQVINKPMISNMLNYPNPFTTSTAFVFTITGSEVPQNIKIQILTVTGKIVREITKDELGPLHIGRNITEFKWDGTDMYGQKLANGVYLYRVVTNLNGKSLDKFKAEGDNTDKYFNKGYGKMYLMR